MDANTGTQDEWVPYRYGLTSLKVNEVEADCVTKQKTQELLFIYTFLTKQNNNQMLGFLLRQSKTLEKSCIVCRMVC